MRRAAGALPIRPPAALDGPIPLGIALGVASILACYVTVMQFGVHGSAALWAGLLFAPVPALVLHYRCDADAHASLGAANVVTMLRAALVAWLLSIPLSLGAGPASDDVLWLSAIIATIAAALDALDGHLARRHGTESTFGARFDVETDAMLLMALCLTLWLFERTGAWILLVAGMRYLFVAASTVWPWLARPLPYSRRRRAICALQMVVLIAALAPVLPHPLVVTITSLAATALVLSFAADIAALSRDRKKPITRALHTLLEPPLGRSTAAPGARPMCLEDRKNP